jgi:hypothetical protein
VLAAVTLAALLALGGNCQQQQNQKGWTDTPKGFVEVAASPFAYKAVSPDGSSIAVRHRPNQEKGDLAFWSEVFERQFVEVNGYRLIEKEELVSEDGVPGQLMTFEYAPDELPYHYSIAIFVSELSLVSLETATELSKLTRYDEAFSAARKSLRVKSAEKASR